MNFWVFILSAIFFAIAVVSAINVVVLTKEPGIEKIFWLLLSWYAAWTLGKVFQK